MKHQKFIPPTLAEFNQHWLTKLPWLWETKVHYVAFYAGVFNLLIFIATCISFWFGNDYHVHLSIPICLSMVSLSGIGIWLYHLSRFSLELDYGHKNDDIIKKRFLAYLVAILLLVLPVNIPSLVSMIIRGHFSEVLLLSLKTVGISFLLTMLLDIWKQVRNKQFIQTVVANVLAFTGMIALMGFSLFFVVLLTLVALFTLPILISSLDTMTEIKEYRNWRVIAISSFQFLSPFLLMLALCLVLIPLSLMGELFFMVMAIISCYVYLQQFLPKFSKIHTHFHALPRGK